MTGAAGLPGAFDERMKKMLGKEYEAFAASYEKPLHPGLRINVLKKGWESLEKEPLFGMKPVPWAPHGFYYDPQTRPGRHPFHEAGVYYMQEPSAMAVAALSGAEPGMRVLDLCAAPGGKSTQLAAMMDGRGVLYSNEIHPARARILSQNIERMGISNAVVTNESPEKLSMKFPLYFDLVVVDAPCSGEGMFRKEAEAVPNWSPDNVQLCAERQKGILDCAAAMTAVGGRIVYSTCTFSPEENEQNVLLFLERHPEFRIVDLPGILGEAFMQRTGLAPGEPSYALQDPPGNAGRLTGCLRLWPHRLDGEGHFMAVLEKSGNAYERNRPAVKPLRDKEAQRLFKEFEEETLTGQGADRLKPRGSAGYVLFGKELYLMPEAAPMDGMKVLRPGLHLGTLKKNRFEPSHALALYLCEDDVLCSADAGGRQQGDSREASAYLRGESLAADSCSRSRGTKGWCLVTDGGFSLGWGKRTGDIIKNHYPKGLRRPY